MKSIFQLAVTLFVMFGLSGCADDLNQKPQSSISPEQYFVNDSQLQDYILNLYPSIFSTVNQGYYGSDDQMTDNQIPETAPDRFFEGQWRVPHNGGAWSFSTIYNINFFLENVLTRYGDGTNSTITGDANAVRHYIGEAYTMRALEYFYRYSQFGDFPIITNTLPDQQDTLTQASKRCPRNEVARFILSDLDKAADLLSGTTLSTTRINRDLALLIKSRVALYEGTWLKYFKGTPFVPNGEGWPGKTKEYNANYQYPSGSIEQEINWFLQQSQDAAKEVAEKYKNSLAVNNGALQQSASDPANDYYDMFAAEDCSKYPEVLLWRQFAYGTLMHGGCIGANQGNWGLGLSRGYIQNFLMADGTPVYTHGTYADGDGYYQGDKTLDDVVANRDGRLTLFLKCPGQVNIFNITTALQSNCETIEPYPGILKASTQVHYNTGYAIRKGGTFSSTHLTDVYKGYTALVLYRSVEALLNYIEASYERTGALDGTAREYWQLIRQRAGVSTDIDATIAATDMSKEAENDWGAYSAGQVISDKTLYNIRRERRCEMMSEGLRYMDVCRWRSMDQLVTSPYIPEGMHLWNTPMEDWYEGEYIIDGSSKANISSPEVSEYVRPFQRTSSQRCYNGYTWKLAHYLQPVMIKQFQLTSVDGQDISTSPIYQNPYWPMVADQAAEK